MKETKDASADPQTEAFDKMDALEVSKHTLGMLKGDGKDFLDWVITNKEKTCEALNDPCDLKQLACDAIQDTLTDTEKMVCTGFSVDGGVIGQVAFPAFMACLAKSRTGKIAKRAKCFTTLSICRGKVYTCKVAVQLLKKILHAVHIGVKIA